jgi:hypothetical protein
MRFWPAKGGSARESHARRVKISRITPPPKNPQAVFIGIFAKKTDGISIAQ